MAQQVRDVMTPDPVMYPATTSVVEAAQAMRDDDIGDVLVERDGAVCGIVTDRDIVIRTVADGADPKEVRLGDICSSELTYLSPDDSVDQAVELMRTQALRRLPVCDGGTAVGIVTLGDLAIERDPSSALADISSTEPDS